MFISCFNFAAFILSFAKVVQCLKKSYKVAMPVATYPGLWKVYMRVQKVDDVVLLRVEFSGYKDCVGEVIYPFLCFHGGIQICREDYMHIQQLLLLQQLLVW